jgi:outer membrane protein OmpA-like peptidoglycan-associated protein
MITLPKELERNSSLDSIPMPSIPDSKRFLVIYFDFRSAALSASARQQLLDFVDLVKMRHAAIQVEGHTDSIGQEAFNEGLSLERASTVRAFLKENGISANRLMVKGWGTSKPAAPNKNEKDGRALNRRVEISVIDN